jgi:hypothetical protein
MGSPFCCLPVFHLQHHQLLHGAEGSSCPSLFLSPILIDQPSQLILDITLCGDWAGVPSVYNATCSGGTTGLCVSPFICFVNRKLTRPIRSTTIMSSVRGVPTMTTPTLRSTSFACTLSRDSLRPFQILCTAPAPAPAPTPTPGVPAIPRAPVLSVGVGRTMVLYSIFHLLSNCFCCASLVFSLFLPKVVERNPHALSQTFAWTLPWTFNTFLYLCTIKTSYA